MNNNWFTTKEIKKNIWGIGEFFHFEEVISYLIVGKRKALLIDTGLNIGNIKSIVESITSNKIIVINTHCHFDHIGENYKFNNIYLFNSKFSLNIASKGYSYFFMKNHSQKKLFFNSPPKEFYDKKYYIPSFKWKKLINDGEKIFIDPFEFVIVYTPGHSPDSICLYEKNLGYLFTGDILYQGPIYVHLNESNLEEYKNSIKKILSLKKINYIFPGHNDFYFDPKNIKKIKKKLEEKKLNKKKIKIDKKISIIKSL
ncbi:MAG: MBL fold metallo-hydrolase [Patescibacteria group bacterium]|nr:MBL fold metallo-hydrolase [Patescibacteria group bacterium]